MESTFSASPSTATSPSMSSPTESAGPVFHLFNKLPVELQNEIWHHAMDEVGERVVEFRDGFYCDANGEAIEVLDDKYQRYPTIADIMNAAANAGDVTANEETPIWAPQFTSPCSIPVFLHTTQGARRCALERWELSFAHGSQPPKVFFDFELDILILDTRPEAAKAFISEIDPNSLLGLQHIAIKPHRRFSVDYAQFGIPLNPLPESTEESLLEQAHEKLLFIRDVWMISEEADMEETESEVNNGVVTLIVLTPTSLPTGPAPQGEAVRRIGIRHCWYFLTALQVFRAELNRDMLWEATKDMAKSIEGKHCREVATRSLAVDIKAVRYQRVSREV